MYVCNTAAENVVLYYCSNLWRNRINFSIADISRLLLRLLVISILIASVLMYVIWWQNIKSLHFTMYVLPGDVGVLLFLDRKKTSPRILRQTCYEISKSNAYWCFIADLGFGEWIQNHASWLSTQIPLTSRTSYIKNAIRKTFCFFKMVYSIFDRISDALITTYLTQLVLINCVYVIR